MQRHAFGFGSAVGARRIMAKGEDADRYREVIEKHFTKVVFENDLKWGTWAWENMKERPTKLAAIDWLRENGIQIRGHVLVWPSWRHMPERIEKMKDDKPALRKTLGY